MMLADSHLHLFRDGYRGVYGKSLFKPDIEVYESLRAVHKIEAGLVVGYEGLGIDPDNNDYIRSLAADRPWLTTLANADLAVPISPAAVSAILQNGHRGMALYVQDETSRAGVLATPAEAWRILEDSKALVSLNVTPEYVSSFASIAENHPSCTFLISHMGLPGSYRDPPKAAEAEARLAPLIALSVMPNVMVKLSAPYAISEPPHAYPHRAADMFMDIIFEHFCSRR